MTRERTARMNPVVAIAILPIVAITGNGQVGFWSPTHLRFIRMPNTDRLDRSGVSSDGSLPTGWGWEQFRVVAV